jgi:glycosyltransferase involved in cell wall biosynthesis
MTSDEGQPRRSRAIALAFVGTVVPDEPRYRTPAFNRAGNNSQHQLVKGLSAEGISDIEVFSALPIPAFPRSRKLWSTSAVEQLDPGIRVRLLAFPNVTPLKQILIGLGVLGGLAWWGWRKRSTNDRVVLTYNLSVPPGPFTWIGARLARAKAVAFVNDVYVSGVTVPGSTLRRFDVWLQRWILPRFDGHLVVSDDIAADFFPGLPYLRIEGGVAPAFFEWTSRTHGTPREPGKPFVMVYAGELDQINGIPILLEALRISRRDNLRLRVAGAGPLLQVVQNAALQDSRIEYLGLLDHNAVAKLYASADLLLNVRLTKAIDTRYFFPSKLVEYLASGVPTLTTNVGHIGSEFAGTVYVLDDESPNGLAELLRHVASQEPDVRSARAQKARELAERHYSWKAQAARIAAYLRNVVLTGGVTRSAANGPSQPHTRR